MKNYLVKRFARIFPLHFIMLLPFLAVALAGDNPIEGLFASVFLLHSWALTDGLVLNGPSWTISAEMFAYLLFGITVFRSPPSWVLAVAFIITALAAHAVAIELGKTGFIHLTWDYGAIRIIPLFILGMLLRRCASFISSGGAMMAGVLGFALFAVFASRSDAGYEILIPFVLLVLSFSRLSDWGALPTNHRLLVYLGEISYSIYMIHIFAVNIWFDYLPKFGLEPLHWQILCVAVVLGSAVSYRFVELPARLWISRSIK